MRTRVKICGITRKQDAEFCAGADAIGLVFYAASPRAVSSEQAVEIIRTLPAFVTTVGLFVDADADYVTEVLAGVKLDCLQFHGNEDATYCEQFERPYIKAIRMAEATDVEGIAKQHASAQALLLDTYVANAPGGTGQTFDWQRVPDIARTCRQPIILAGGLTSENVGEAIRIAKPYAVDVSGGVELVKGSKDAAKIEKFIHEVESVGANR